MGGMERKGRGREWGEGVEKEGKWGRDRGKGRRGKKGESGTGKGRRVWERR